MHVHMYIHIPATCTVQRSMELYTKTFLICIGLRKREVKIGVPINDEDERKVLLQVIRLSFTEVFPSAFQIL